MTGKTTKVRVWKLKIDGKVERETIEATLSDTCREALKRGYLEGSSGVLERIDIREKETVVFISETPKAAKIFSDALGAYVPRKKVTLSQVSQADVMKFT